MPWLLLALHAKEDPVPLPCDGDASIGRRPNNFLICQDRSVSGTHCILHCTASGPPEFEDCSTNGSSVNELKLQKGERQKLAHGDVLSLTKPAEDGTASGPRVQYKLVYEEHKEADAGEIPATAPDPKHAEAERAEVISVEPCFAQDLLVQEQQSKAKLTADLLVSQRKLEDERHTVDNLTRELRRTRQQVEEERLKRQDAEDSRTKLTSEMEALRVEARQLEEVTLAHEDLRVRHSTCEQELRKRLGRCEELETEQLQLRKELEEATEAQQKCAQQLAELQTRARQAQERAERLQQQHQEAQSEVERTTEERQRMEEELQEAATARAKLEEDVAASQAAVEKAESAERLTRAELDTATSKRAELECQASAAQSEADSARIAATSAQQRLAKSQLLGQHLSEAGRSLSAELKRRLELWDKVLLQGLPAAAQLFEEALAGDVAPTFAQATCRVEEAPSSSHEFKKGESPTKGEEPLAAQATVAAIDLDQSEVAQAVQTVAGGMANGLSGAAGLLSQAERTGADGQGCSTAWSLEVMEIDPPSKKMRTC